MKIVTAPQPCLRTQATPITKIDRRLHKFLQELEKTLQHSKNPKGVGLAANQVDRPWRIFCTQLLEAKDAHVQHYINPVIIDRSSDLILGLTPAHKKAREEGCLSIPDLYGPVPRSSVVKLQFQRLINDELLNFEEVFENFPARVIQHELDHLNGILFTDYSLKFDLPVFRENKSGEWDEIDKSELENF